MPSSNNDYKTLLTQIIQKQVVILGPDIAISQAKKVEGLTVSDDGTVTDVNESKGQEITQNLVNEYVALSGLIVKKAMEPLLSKYPSVKLEE